MPRKKKIKGSFISKITDNHSVQVSGIEGEEYEIAVRELCGFIKEPNARGDIETTGGQRIECQLAFSSIGLHAVKIGAYEITLEDFTRFVITVLKAEISKYGVLSPDFDLLIQSLIFRYLRSYLPS